jgi:hypothetical protein
LRGKVSLSHAGGPNQNFWLEKAEVIVPGTAYEGYRIVAHLSAKVLDVERASLENGAKVIPVGLARRAKPRLQYSGGQYSGKLLDVAGLADSRGQLIQWSGLTAPIRASGCNWVEGSYRLVRVTSHEPYRFRYDQDVDTSAMCDVLTDRFQVGGWRGTESAFKFDQL